MDAFLRVPKSSVKRRNNALWEFAHKQCKDDIEATLHLISADLYMAELWGQFQKSNFYDKPLS